MSNTHRMRAVQPPIVPIVGRWIRETPGTISLGQGMVAYGPPPEALERVRAFGADPDDHRYGPVEGEPELVEAIERKLAHENGIDPRPLSRVVVTAGGNMAFLNAVLAVTDPGDEVVLQAPFYFNHEMAVVIAGCRPVTVATDEDYQLQPGAIAAAITPRTRAIVTISPNNPTGAVYPEAALRTVNELCAARGLFHVHDEAYEYFTYEGTCHFSPGSIEDAGRHTISLFSLSKAYGFASWRIGYMVLPEPLFDAVNKIQDTNLICPPRVSQHAALGALGVGPAYTRPHVAALARVRDEVHARLGAVADLCDIPRTQGAFYCFLRLKGSVDPVTVAERLVREHLVAVIPGTAFGATDGPYLRVSYGALDADTVVEGIDRLVRGLRAVIRGR
jgi:aspartate/methionine/tyrosine aminotransferase